MIRTFFSPPIGASSWASATLAQRSRDAAEVLKTQFSVPAGYDSWSHWHNVNHPRQAKLERYVWNSPGVGGSSKVVKILLGKDKQYEVVKGVDNARFLRHKPSGVVFKQLKTPSFLDKLLKMGIVSAIGYGFGAAGAEMQIRAIGNVFKGGLSDLLKAPLLVQLGTYLPYVPTAMLAKRSVRLEGKGWILPWLAGIGVTAGLASRYVSVIKRAVINVGTYDPTQYDPSLFFGGDI